MYSFIISSQDAFPDHNPENLFCVAAPARCSILLWLAILVSSLCLGQGFFFHHLHNALSPHQIPKVILWRARQTSFLTCGKEDLSETERHRQIITLVRTEQQDTRKVYKAKTPWEVMEANFTGFWYEGWTLIGLHFYFPFTRHSFFPYSLILSYLGMSFTFFIWADGLCMLCASPCARRAGESGRQRCSSEARGE